MKYQKRPIVVEAFQLLAPSSVRTLEGMMEGNVGDWLIRGIQGELYFCKDEIFRATYEPVPDETPVSVVKPTRGPDRQPRQRKALGATVVPLPVVDSPTYSPIRS